MKTKRQPLPVVLVCAPKYDALTVFTSSLAEGFQSTYGYPKSIILDKPTTLYKLLDDLLIEDKTEIVLVFTGHGTPDALLGPPGSDSDIRTSQGSHSVFYNSGHRVQGIRVIIAFCCSSAEKLGDYVASQGTIFLGYKERIGFILKEGDYKDWPQRILQAISEQAFELNEGSSLGKREAKQAIKDLYLEAYNYFKTGKGKANEYSPYMAALLWAQREVFDIL